MFDLSPKSRLQYNKVASAKNSTLNFTRQQWSTLAITAQQHCYWPTILLPLSYHHIPLNNWDAELCMLCQLALGGQIDIIQSSGGVECVNHSKPLHSRPHFSDSITCISLILWHVFLCAQWGHTKVHFPFGRQPFMLSLRQATHPQPKSLSPSGLAPYVCVRRDTVTVVDKLL